MSDKFKHSDEGFKYFTGYQKDEIVKPLCIILPQMSGYIKYFENGGKNMSFLIKDDEVWEKYEKIWDVIKNKLSIKFHSKPIYDQKYLKAKVREFDGMDSVMRMDKKNHLQVYLEECKYKIKKIQMSRFINNELKSDSHSDELDSEAKSKSHTE